MPHNNHLADATRLRNRAFVAQDLSAFPPTLVAKKPAARNGILAPRETVRRIQARLELTQAEEVGREVRFSAPGLVPGFDELVQINRRMASTEPSPQ